jgi:hypothetical protein
MAREAHCARCDELWCAYASASRDHLLALKEQEEAARQDPERFRTLEMKAEALGADRAAARVKITTHLALSHSGRTYSALVSASAH